MSNANLKVTITAVDKASSSLGKVGGGFSKMGALGAAAAVGVAAFGVSSVKAFAEAEAAQAELQDTFDRFPRLADVSIDSLRDYNTELQSKTRFDDDAIASGQALLGQYELTGKQLQDLTPLVADFAAKTGQSFESAAAAVGKGLLGSGKAFKQLGIDFEDTGTQAGNLEQIMGGLRSQVGGFAEKEAQTGIGASERLKNQMGELQETVGQELLPALVGIANVATDVVGGFNDMGSAQRDTLLQTVALTTLVAAGATKAKGAFDSMGAAMGGSAAAAGAVTLGLAAVVGAVSGYANVTKAFEELEDAAAESGAALASSWKSSTMREINDGLALMADNTDQAAAAFQKLSPDVQTALTSIDAIDQKMTDLMESEGFWDQFGDNFESIVLYLNEGAGGFNNLGREADGARDKLAQSGAEFDTVIASVAQMTDLPIERVRALAEAAGVDLSQGVMGASEALADYARTAETGSVSGNKAATAAETVGDKASSSEDKVKALKDALSALNDTYLDMARGSDNVEAQWDEATATIAAQGDAIKIVNGEIWNGNEAGREARGAMFDLAGGYQQLAAETFEATGSQEKANAVLQTGRDKILALGRQAGLSKGEAQKLADKLLGLDKKWTPEVEVSTTVKPSKAKTEFDEARWRALNKKPYTIPVILNYQVQNGGQATYSIEGSDGVRTDVTVGPGGPNREFGGPVRQGMPYIVGEKRPELFVPSQSGRIIPRVPTPPATATPSGGVTVIVQGHALASKDEIARTVVDALKSSGERGLVLS